LVKPFELGWTAHRAIAFSTQRIEPMEFDGVAETEIADSNQALGEAVA